MILSPPFGCMNCFLPDDTVSSRSLHVMFHLCFPLHLPWVHGEDHLLRLPWKVIMFQSTRRARPRQKGELGDGAEPPARAAAHVGKSLEAAAPAAPALPPLALALLVSFKGQPHRSSWRQQEDLCSGWRKIFLGLHETLRSCRFWT